VISGRSAGLRITFLAFLGASAATAQNPPSAVDAGGQRKGHKMTWSVPGDSAFFGIEDLYKLLHQAYLGPGHAIPSREAAEAYLQSEWADLGAPEAGEPLIEVLAEGAPFVRVHLRPYRERGGTADSLLGAFLRSAAVAKDSVSFERAWGLARERIARGEIPLSIAVYDSAEAELRPLGYPAIHHSAAYQKHLRPAYRVIAAREAQRVQICLPSGKNR
jgi:hypothetical protein